MGFLKGRVTYRMFSETTPCELESSLLVDRLKRMSHCGGGDHVLDDVISEEKNCVDDTIHFGMRAETNEAPASLKKAYYQLELDAIVEEGKIPNKRQRECAKEASLEKLREEGKDGRFKRATLIPALWDRRQKAIYLGATNDTALSMLNGVYMSLTNHSRPIRPLSPLELAERATGKELDHTNVMPRQFGDHPATTPHWYPVGAHYLGNDFLTWLLMCTNDCLTLPDASEVSWLPIKTISLECPRAENGKDTLRAEFPADLTETTAAIRSGKLVRRMGLTISRHNESYDLTLGDNLAVYSAKLPTIGKKPDWKFDRIAQIRHLSETIRLLFEAFVRECGLGRGDL